MAQTTVSIPSGIALVSFSATSTFADHSGTIAEVTHSGGDQQIGQGYTQGSDYQLVVPGGKVEAITTTVRGYYTEDAGELWALLYTEWTTAGPKEIFFKYSPAGGNSGDLEYIATDDVGTSAGVAVAIQNLREPNVAESGDIIPFEVVLMIPRFLDATIA